MSLFDFFKKQLQTVIEWQPQQSDLLIWKYPAATDEIKNASKLIVSPGQGCILVKEGKVTDVFTEQGTFSLSTDNFPFITNVLKAVQLFESEHKVGLYYFRSADVMNQGWGTSSPIKYMDSQYNIPIQLAAHGNFSYRLLDPEKLFTQLVGTVRQYSTQEFRDVAQSRILQILTSHFSKAQLPFNKIDSQLNEISKQVKEELNNEFEILGMQLIDFRIEGNFFDEETEKRIGRIADITSDSLAAAEGGLSYAELEKLKALRDAAKNEGGLAAVGASLGAGVSLSQIFTDKVDELSKGDPSDDPLKRLQKLKILLDENIITQEEFDAKKKEILKDI